MSGTDLPTQKISDEDVELVAKVLWEETLRDVSPTVPRINRPTPECYSDAKAVLERLVASGYRREADVLREAAASIDRHVDSYEVVSRQTIQRLKDTGRSEEDIRQRQRLERRYVRGLLAAADDLYELAEKAEKREPATALEQAQPLLAAGSEVESLEPVEPSEGQERSEEKEHG